MTPERAEELAEARDGPSGYNLTLVIKEIILQACAEERTEVLKGEFICSKCCLRKDSEHEAKHEF